MSVNMLKLKCFLLLQELGRCQWVKLKLVSWSLAWCWRSPLPSSLQRSSLLRCTTRGWRRLCPATMLALTSRTCPWRTCGVGTWLGTLSRILLQMLKALTLRLVHCRKKLPHFFGLFPLNLAFVLGDNPEPSREDQSRLLPSSGLPHSPRHLPFRWAEGEARPPHWQEAGGPPADPHVWRCSHSQTGPHQAHVCGELLHIPSFR